jgi:Fibronectin type III domain/Kelch motif
MARRSSVLALAAAVFAVAVPAAHADGWAPGGDLNTARFGEALVTLHGGDALAIGGDSSSTIEKSVERYSTSSGTWQTVAPMNVARIAALAATLDDGRVLAAGGSGNASAEVYDPQADTWTPVPGGMRDARGAAGVAAFGQNGIAPLGVGRFLLAGGMSPTVHADIFDPSANSGAGAFTAAADMGTARQGPTEAALTDGRVLVAGGVGVSGVLATAEVYDPRSNTWTPVANSLTAPVAGASAAPIPGGKVLIFGGANGSPAIAPVTNAEIYDPATNRFTPTAPMSHAHLLGFGTSLADGRVLAGGGTESFFGTGNGAAEIYDPSIGGWYPTAPTPSSALESAATTLPTGQVLVAGGATGITGGPPTPIADTEVFTPSPPLSAPRAVSAVADDGAATVSWTAPASDGGAAIDHYTVTASTGQVVATSDARTSITVGGLANGRPVTFAVTARTVRGTSPGGTSPAVTPSGPDKTAPTLKITRLHSKLKLKSFLRGVTATVKPSEALSLSISLLASVRKATIAKAFNLTLGTKSYKRTASTRHIKVRPSRKLVGRIHKFTVHLRIVATDAAGNTRTVTKAIRVTR